VLLKYLTCSIGQDHVEIVSLHASVLMHSIERRTKWRIIDVLPI